MKIFRYLVTILKKNPPTDMLSFGSSSACANGSLSLTSSLAMSCYSLSKLKISPETTNIN